MSTTLKQAVAGGAVSLLTTELNSLANNTNASPSSAINNVAGGTSNADGYVRGTLELYLAAYSGTPTIYGALYVWFLKTVDGTNYEDGSSSVTPPRAPDAVIPIRDVASGPQRSMSAEVLVPAGSWKALALNAGTGITFASSGNTLKILFDTDTSV